MTVYEVCGSGYDKPIEVSDGGGGLHTLDSLDRAIHPSTVLEVPGTPDMPEVPEPSPPQEPGPGGTPEVPSPDPKGPETPQED